jgi:hypothetical protein
LLDWISNLCLYITPDGPDTFKLVFSKFLVDYLQQFPPGDTTRVVLLAGLLDQLKDFPSVLDQGRILETIFAQALGCHLAAADKFGDLAVLQDTLLCNVAVVRDIGRGFNIRFLPSFQPKTTSGVPHKEDGIIKSYNPSDWHLFFQNIITDNNVNVVGIVREQNSSGPDLLLPIKATKLPDEIYSLGIALKASFIISIIDTLLIIVSFIAELSTQNNYKLD